MEEKRETKSYRVVYYPDKRHPKEIYLIEGRVINYLKSKPPYLKNDGLVNLVRNDSQINKETTTQGLPRVIIATLKKEG